MQLERKTATHPSAVKSAGAFLMVFLLLFASLLAVSPAHNRAHQESKSDANHPCALCVFAHGQVDVADSAPVLITHFVEVPVVAAVALPTILPAPDFQLLPGRAPPV